MPNVLPLTRDDADAISTLAATVWHAHYANIISSAQIEYMLHQRYGPALIRTQILSNNTWWKKLVLHNEIIGFSCCKLTDRPNELKLDKLYLHPHHQRKGYGAILVDNIKHFMHQHSLTILILTVNKNNISAIAAYRQYGFIISDEVVKDIGNGFVMDDYLMTMTIK